MPTSSFQRLTRLGRAMACAIVSGCATAPAAPAANIRLATTAPAAWQPPIHEAAQAEPPTVLYRLDARAR